MGISGGNEFRAVIERDGKQEVFCTDDEGEYIRFNLEQRLLDYELGGSVKVEPQGERWFRVEVTFPPANDENSDALNNLYEDFDVAFTGKGWYECSRRGGNDDGSVLWFVVRYNRGCPVI